MAHRRPLVATMSATTEHRPSNIARRTGIAYLVIIST
jgi:hypothetical protein